MDNLIGKVSGRYKLKSLIGEGGMATVYLAEDTTLHREVAVKMIRVGEIPPNQLPRMLERFKREAEALARLSDDPAIVTVHDYGEYDDAPYLVMAYMPGGTLKDRLSAPMDYREAAELLLSVTEALALAHEHGIVHRDVKPSNLLVDRKGNLALADFGIAKALEVDGQTLTGTGIGVGTPEYMAPEQWKGEASPQTDVYALGVVLYEMVTGKKPYSAGTPSEVFLKQMTQPPDRPRDLVPSLPESVEALLDRAMDEDPAARFASMAAFQAALEGVLKEEPAHDETPVALGQPAADPEATFDLLATPAPLGEVPLPAQDEGEEEPQARGEGKRKWWLAGVGVIVVGGIVWGIMAGGNKVAPVSEEPIVTETEVSTATLEATEIKISTQTGTLNAEPMVTVTPAPTLGIGSTMISEKDDMEMVYVPAGEFAMGSDYGDENEQPEHQVYLDAYWIDKYEVTTAQFVMFLNERGIQIKSGEPWLDSKDDDAIIYQENGIWQVVTGYERYPVNQVNWYGAFAYCEWVGRRLPSEAEWEKAARGIDGRTYPWGNDSPHAGLLNFRGNESGTTVVGSYPEGASPYGALDMAGNVWEWVSDWYDAEYYRKSPVDNPQGPSSGDYPVMRGSYWSSVEWNTRSTNRSPGAILNYGGFRCAMRADEIELDHDSENGTGALQTATPIAANSSGSTLGLGSTMLSEKDGMEMVYVPAGEFIMGSDKGYDDEKPSHVVSLDAFWIDKYEVTNAQYKQCVESGACNLPGNTKYYMDPLFVDHPVNYMPWAYAEKYCSWAGRRLPTEAEWEKAARGIDGRDYPWGNEPPNQGLLNFDYVEGETVPVGSFPDGASPYGAMDMAGNVWEWVADWYDVDYYSGSEVGTNPMGPTSGSRRSMRSSAWYSSSREALSWSRASWNPAETYGGQGFRCAMSEWDVD